METVHLILGVAVLATNARRRCGAEDRVAAAPPSVGFWYVLRAAQVAVVSRCSRGRSCSCSDDEAADDLHYVYGVLPLLVSLLAEAARAGAAERELAGLDFESLPKERQRLIALGIVRREMGIMAISALVILFLALRAAGTSTLWIL